MPFASTAKRQHCVLWLDGAKVAYRTSSRIGGVPTEPAAGEVVRQMRRAASS